jgi:adenylate kinase
MKKENLPNSQFTVHHSQFNHLRLVILGPPGSGKGTQAARLSSKFEIKRISTGDLLRDGIKKGTDLGKKSKEYVEKGNLVPDSLMLGLIRECLQSLKGGFILDGFPRTLPQGEELEDLLMKRNTPLLGALSLEIAENALIHRLTQRRICNQCGTLYNLVTSPPRENGKCDRCGGGLLQREDDLEDTVRKRLVVYKNETFPLKEFYNKKDILFPVEGEGKIEEIGNRMEKIIQGIAQVYG